MNHKYIYLIILFCAISLCSIFFVFSKTYNNKNVVAEINKTKENKKIILATCPTYYDIAKKIDPENYQIIPTASTAESIYLLLQNKVDMILSGRTLKPEEPKMESLLIEEGYSFLSNYERTIYLNDLKNHIIYTDLNATVIKDIFAVERVFEVNDVYKYLNKGIIVTSWQNTNYHKSEIVHLLDNNGNRVKPSRQLSIYCPKNCSQEAHELAMIIK